MKNEAERTTLQENNSKSVIDKEFKEYQERDERTTRRVFGILSVIWETIVYFFS